MEKSTTKYAKKLKELHIYIGLIIFFILVFIFIYSISKKTEAIIFEDEGVNKIKSVKVLENGEFEEIGMPKAVPVGKELEYYIDLSEYENLENKSIAAFYTYVDAEIYADDKLIYEIKKGDDALLMSNAYTAAIFDIPRDLKDRYIRVKVRPLLPDFNKYTLREMFIGRKSDIILAQIKENAALFLVSIFLCINFLVALFINLKDKSFFKSEDYSFLQMSVFGVLMAMYFNSQLWLVVYLMSEAKEFMYFIEYFSLSLIVAPACLFMKPKTNKKFAKPLYIMAGILLANIIIQTVLSFAKIIEFKQMLYLTHAFMLIAILVIMISFFFTNSDECPSKKELMLPVVMIAGIGIFSVVYYIIYRDLAFKTVSIVIAIALIIIEIKEVYEKYKNYRTLRIEKKLYEKLAVKDSLTGLFNRQAHEEFITRIKEVNISGWILSIDLNNLKYINDAFGHIKGDELILNFAKILEKKQEENDKINIFRIGGDEFFIFLEEDENFDIMGFVAELKEKYSSASNFEDGFTQSFSAGCSYYSADLNQDVMGVYHIADKLMYEDKAQYKKKFRKYIVRLEGKKTYES